MDTSLWQRVESIRHTLPRTETIELPHRRVRLFVKMESANPSGSAKDRAAHWILREAVRRGDIARGTTIIESSSGNFALSLALFCRTLGNPFVPVIDPNINSSTERTLRRVCARVEKVDVADSSGGFLLSRLARVSEMVGELDDVYWPNQYSNPDGARGHYEFTGGELVESVEPIDYLFVGIGTGAMIAGLSHRVADSFPDVTVVAVDVEGSAIFHGKPRRRLIPGIGSSIRPPLVEEALISDVVMVSERDEIKGAHDLLRDHGIFAGGSTGAVYAAINRYFDKYRGPPPVVAFVCADRGGAYADTIYSPPWVTANFPSAMSTRLP